MSAGPRRRAGWIALLAALLSAAAAPAVPRREGVRGFVARVYRPYVRGEHGGPGFEARGLLGADLLRLLALDRRRNGGTIGLIDSDLLCACQDFGDFGYRILAIRTVAPRTFVTVRLRNYGHVERLTLVLAADARGRFVIDDIIDGAYRPSVKAWLARRIGPNERR